MGIGEVQKNKQTPQLLRTKFLRDSVGNGNYFVPLGLTQNLSLAVKLVNG